MKKLKKFIIIGLLFLASLTVPQTYAYWSNVNYSVSQDLNTVIVGEWTFSTVWVSGTTYNINDVVIFNGIMYRSLRDSNTRTPGANNASNWWVVN